MLARTCRPLIAFALIALFARAVAAQGTFEGLVVGNFKTDGKSIPFRYHQLGSRVRQEFAMENTSIVSIYDGTTGDMITIMPQQKKYMVVNMREAGAAMRRMTGGGQKSPDLSAMKVTDLGRQETIAGLRCSHYLFENTAAKDHSTIDMCGAKGLGFMGMPGEGGSSMPSTIALLRSQNPTLLKLAQEGFFPLRMTITGQRGKPVEWEVTQVDRRRPAAALFQPPAGYTQLTIPGMGGNR